MIDTSSSSILLKEKVMNEFTIEAITSKLVESYKKIISFV